VFGPRLLPRKVDACLRDLESAKLEVRLSAVRDLGRHTTGPEQGKVRASLCRALAKDAAVAVRAEAAVQLADAGAREHLDELCDALEDPALRVRQMALVAVGELATPADERAGDAARALLEDLAPELRFQALIAARSLLPASEFAAGLARAHGDEDAEVRYIALRLAEETWTDSTSPPPSVLAAAEHATRDPSAKVRLVAAVVLVRADKPAGSELLAELLNGSGARLSLEDEAEALSLAGKHGVRAALPGLRRRAFGGIFSTSPVSWQARVALARLGDPRARKAIVGGLSAWTRDGRTLAVVAAGEARLSEARPKLEALARESGGADAAALERALELLAEDTQT
jgi:HEAT repeat protein